MNVANYGTRTAAAVTLLALLAGQSLPASAAASSRKAAPAQVQGTQRTLQALNRFTFGPRPGDVAAVDQQGLDHWFEQQLNPSRINDSALDARLAHYPAMNLSVAQLEARYPGPQAIKQMIDGKRSMPSDPAQLALVEDQVAAYKLQKARQESQKTGQPGDTGPTPMAHVRVAQIIALPPDARLNAILALAPDDFLSFRKGLKGPDADALRANLSPSQEETIEAVGGSVRMVTAEETDTRLLRDIYSDRQLEAVMTDFWLNHFNVFHGKNQQEPYLIPTYERDTIRAHALGNFEDLLFASAESPAMLEYLDNARSIGPNSVAAQKQKKQAGLNENYGRELMELHTLGVNGGYTQADVTNVAKVFTGWTVERPDAEDGGTFTFVERRHEPGPKVVLGKTIPPNGMNEGLEVLHMLATSPATAHFVCNKLAVRFVSDNPPPALVERMAASFLNSHGDIKTVLRTMWKSPEFWAPDTYRAKVKTPEEFVVSAIRASNADVTDPGALVQALGRLGMPLYGMPTPQGYSWKQDDWMNTAALVSRMNFALVLTGNKLGGTTMHFADPVAQSSAKVVATEYSATDAAQAKEFSLESTLMGEPVSPRTRAAVLSQANDASVTEQAATQFNLVPPGKGQIYRPRVQGKPGPPPADPQAAVMAGLLLGSPEFQRR